MEPYSHILILSKYPQGELKDLLHNHPPCSLIILIQDAVYLDYFPGEFVYVLDEDLKYRGLTSLFPTISYMKMIQIIVNAKNIVVL